MDNVVFVSPYFWTAVIVAGILAMLLWINARRLLELEVEREVYKSKWENAESELQSRRIADELARSEREWRTEKPKRPTSSSLANSGKRSSIPHRPAPRPSYRGIKDSSHAEEREESLLGKALDVAGDVALGAVVADAVSDLFDGSEPEASENPAFEPPEELDVVDMIGDAIEETAEEIVGEDIADAVEDAFENLFEPEEDGE